jgi:hypothetical protein
MVLTCSLFTSRVDSAEAGRLVAGFRFCAYVPLQDNKDACHRHATHRVYSVSCGLIYCSVWTVLSTCPLSLPVDGRGFLAISAVIWLA